MLHCQSSETRITDKRTSRLAVGDKPLQKLQMPRPRLYHNYSRLGEPVSKVLKCHGRSICFAQEAPVCANAKKSPNRRPWQPDQFRPLEKLRKPRCGGRMLRIIFVVSVNEDINIEDNHRWSGPSRYSSSASVQS